MGERERRDLKFSKAVVVADGDPRHPRSGADLRTHGILKALRGLVGEVHLVTMVGSSRLPLGDGRSPIELDSYREVKSEGVSKLLFAGLNSLTFGLLPVRRLLPSARARKEFVEGLEASDPDLVVLGYTHLAPLATLAAKDGRAIVVDCHNHDSLLLRRGVRASRSPARKVVRYSQYVAIRRIEGKMGGLVDQVWVPAPSDKESLERAGVGPVRLVPAGLDTSDYVPRAGAPCTVGFTGSLWYPPNQEAVRILVGEVFPKVVGLVPDARVVIAGSRPPEWMRKAAGGGISLEADVPDIRRVLGRFSVAAIPLLRGGGMKVKVLEAMAMGKAVVTTEKGAEGIGARDGEDILIREVGDLHSAIAGLLRDDAARERLGKRARELVERRYSIEALRRSLGVALRGLERR